jgi:hypothetical protein
VSVHGQRIEVSRSTAELIRCFGWSDFRLRSDPAVIIVSFLTLVPSGTTLTTWYP